MKSSSNKKRSVIVLNKRTSICLEDAFWHSLHAIAQIEGTTIEHFIEQVKREHDPLNLSSSVRVEILDYFQRLVARDTPAGDQASSPDHNGRRQRDRVVQFWSGLRSGLRSLAPHGG